MLAPRSTIGGTFSRWDRRVLKFSWWYMRASVQRHVIVPTAGLMFRLVWRVPLVWSACACLRWSPAARSDTAASTPSLLWYTEGTGHLWHLQSALTSKHISTAADESHPGQSGDHVLLEDGGLGQPGPDVCAHKLRRQTRRYHSLRWILSSLIHHPSTTYSLWLFLHKMWPVTEAVWHISSSSNRKLVTHPHVFCSTFPYWDADSQKHYLHQQQQVRIRNRWLELQSLKQLQNNHTRHVELVPLLQGRGGKQLIESYFQKCAIC